MKTKEQIIAEMQHDPHWKIPDADKLGFYGDEIVKGETAKFTREVERRLKIQHSREARELHKKSNPLYFVTDFLNAERKKYEQHYEQDIHGQENWKSFENMQKIDFVLKMLYDLESELTNKHKNVQAEVEKKTEETVAEMLNQIRKV